MLYLYFRHISCALVLVFCMVACDTHSVDGPVKAPDESLANNTNAHTLTVYKSPNCGCCGEWVEHIKQHSFNAAIEHPEDLNTIKDQYGIKPELQSCHTAVTSDGYVFEGHVPARYIHQFLEAPLENALGLSVPGMPLGSPGMEMGDRFTPYDILLVNKDGSSEVYISVGS